MFKEFLKIISAQNRINKNIKKIFLNISLKTCLPNALLHLDQQNYQLNKIGNM